MAHPRRSREVQTGPRDRPAVVPKAQELHRGAAPDAGNGPLAGCQAACWPALVRRRASVMSASRSALVNYAVRPAAPVAPRAEAVVGARPRAGRTRRSAPGTARPSRRSRAMRGRGSTTPAPRLGTTRPPRSSASPPRPPPRRPGSGAPTTEPIGAGRVRRHLGGHVCGGRGRGTTTSNVQTPVVPIRSGRRERSCARPTTTSPARDTSQRESQGDTT